jgi:hypothetical protein
VPRTISLARPRSGVRPKSGAVDDRLLAYLDTLPERFLGYLNDDDELSAYTVKRLLVNASALLAGSITASALAEGWPDWSDLTRAFVLAYGTEDLQAVEAPAAFLSAVKENDDVALTDAERAYLEALIAMLDVYPEIHAAGPVERGGSSGSDSCAVADDTLPNARSDR